MSKTNKDQTSSTNNANQDKTSSTNNANQTSDSKHDTTNTILKLDIDPRMRLRESYEGVYEPSTSNDNKE